jgi:hypothetical protein
MIARLLAAVLHYEQKPLYYCARCAGHYPVSHFPCI